MVPVDVYDTLEDTWRSICVNYDVTAELPDMQTLFAGVDLADPAQASEKVIANMLSEAMECIGRFSPWYKKPASAFGLVPLQDAATRRTRWVLSDSTAQEWRPVLRQLSVAIERNIGLILSAHLIDDLESTALADDPCLMASCACAPPRLIMTKRSVLVGAKIKCDACQHLFRPIGEAPGADAWFS